MIEEFADASRDNAHRLFQGWRRANPEGFFINQQKGATYLLHTTQCRHLGDTKWSTDSGHSLTHKKKVCATKRAELEDWATIQGFSVTPCRDCGPHKTCANFIAYHSSELMGEEYWPTEQFHFFSRKPERFLRRAIGSRTWVVVSVRKSTRLAYWLAGVFTGAEVSPEGDGFGITGQGTPFRPPFEIGPLPWFNELLREQNRFSYGFNELRGKKVTDGLQGLLEQYGGEAVLQAGETSDGTRFIEGAVQRVFINRYERDPFARQRCIKHHGCRCMVCGFDFEKAYGELGRGFIHVHHLKPLSEIKEEYEVDPIADMHPVCANCHAMIHRGSEMLSIGELKKRLQRTHHRSARQA